MSIDLESEILSNSSSSFMYLLAFLLQILPARVLKLIDSFLDISDLKSVQNYYYLNINFWSEKIYSEISIICDNGKLVVNKSRDCVQPVFFAIAATFRYQCLSYQELTVVYFNKNYSCRVTF